jgi:hypothetical protein
MRDLLKGLFDLIELNGLMTASIFFIAGHTPLRSMRCVRPWGAGAHNQRAQRCGGWVSRIEGRCHKSRAN